jgi:glycosyltransferase involved in cell wall biosynthesis
MEIKVSVVIPCYEYGGKGVRYLSDILRTISQQTLKEVEVIIPDHSVNTDIEEFCHDNIFDLNILHYRNEVDRGNAASNKNVGMDFARGKVVKMMYMDDYFFTNDALEKTYNTLMNSDKMWLVCGTNHTRDDGKTFDTYIIPRWNDNMLRSRGNNTMSGVSVLSYKNNNMHIRWDPNTCMLMDVDFYYSLRSKYGDCIYLNDCMITQRVNNDALSSTTSDEDVQKEFVYCREKHGIIL